MRTAPVSLFLAALGACAELPAQQLPAADPVIHVSVNLVQVDAVVTDSQGHPVPDLQPRDFEILEDHKAQKITNFSYIELKPAMNAAGTQRALRREDVRRSIVLMVDDGSIDEQGVQAVTKAARRFVSDQMSPGDLVAITGTRGGMGFYQQFTGSKRCSMRRSTI